MKPERKDSFGEVMMDDREGEEDWSVVFEFSEVKPSPASASIELEYEASKREIERTEEESAESAYAGTCS